MAWIDTIALDTADEQLRERYEEIINARGKVSNIMKAHSLNPAAMASHLELYDTLLFDGSSPLSRAEREAIAVVVSAENDCTYCIDHHQQALAAYWSQDRAERLATDYRLVSDLSEQLQAACETATKLTRSPNAMTEGDVDTLRNAGWSDRAILDIVLVTAYFNFVNRIATGLGVEVTPEEVSGYDYDPDSAQDSEE